jgi:hypothetical protein
MVPQPWSPAATATGDLGELCFSQLVLPGCASEASLVLRREGRPEAPAFTFQGDLKMRTDLAIAATVINGKCHYRQAGGNLDPLMLDAQT